MNRAARHDGARRRIFGLDIVQVPPALQRRSRRGADRRVNAELRRRCAARADRRSRLHHRLPPAENFVLVVRQHEEHVRAVGARRPGRRHGSRRRWRWRPTGLDVGAPFGVGVAICGAPGDVWCAACAPETLALRRVLRRVHHAVTVRCRVAEGLAVGQRAYCCVGAVVDVDRGSVAIDAGRFGVRRLENSTRDDREHWAAP